MRPIDTILSGETTLDEEPASDNVADSSVPVI